jgi:hypothetical protein
LSALPASAEALCGFLADQASLGKRARHARETLGRHPLLSSRRRLRHADRRREGQGSASGIRRTIGAAPIRKKPATSDLVLGMVGGKGRSLRELRDRAILLLGFAGAFRRSELVALNVEEQRDSARGQMQKLPTVGKFHFNLP